MKTSALLAVCAAVVAVLNLSGCVEQRDEVGYRYEQGDRISSDGRRDVGWCQVHADNEHCRTAVAESP